MLKKKITKLQKQATKYNSSLLQHHITHIMFIIKEEENIKQTVGQMLYYKTIL